MSRSSSAAPALPVARAPPTGFNRLASIPSVLAVSSAVAASDSTTATWTSSMCMWAVFSATPRRSSHPSGGI